MPKGVHNNHRRASQQHRWRPGGQVAANGYVKVRVGKSHPLADPNGYAYEHLVVWCAAGNTRPPRGWVIHHLNHDKTDNRIENLSAQPRGAHNAHHNAERGRDETAGRHLDGRTWDQVPDMAHDFRRIA